MPALASPWNPLNASDGADRAIDPGCRTPTGVEPEQFRIIVPYNNSLVNRLSIGNHA